MTIQVELKVLQKIYWHTSSGHTSPGHTCHGHILPSILPLDSNSFIVTIYLTDKQSHIVYLDFRNIYILSEIKSKYPDYLL